METAAQDEPATASSMPSTSAPSSWGSWFASAQQQAAELALKAQENFEIAKKIAQEKAAELAKQAEDMRQHYDLEVATSILMGTVGGPVGADSITKKKDKQSFKDLDLVYVTENVISMAFPCDFTKNAGTQTGNDIDVVAAYLKKRHAGHYMIWNISEEGYDYSKFSDQVLEYKFPGHPSPPLGLLFKICTSIESWLDADERNVAVVHCLTGKGRTAALIACVMAWLGEFTTPMEALQYIADRRGFTVDNLTIPSQRRYVQYFSNMLDGVKPRSEPLLLRRVILNSIPLFGTEQEDGVDLGCCPYVQLFKNGKLIATSAAQGSNNPDDKLSLRWIKGEEGSASFSVDCVVQGDILLRCRHAARSGARVSMFRCGFHTGYVPSGVLRLTKAQLDGSSSDSRYSEDFFVDLIFAPVQAASTEVVNTSATISSATDTSSVSDSGLLLDAFSTDKFEMTLHKDIKFWESISLRKQKAKKRKSRKFLSTQQDRFSIADDVAGSDNTDTTEVSFYSSFAAPSSSTRSPSDVDYSSVSDIDLIKQLAELEGGSSDLLDASTEEGYYAANASRTDAAGHSIFQSNAGGASELQALEDLEKELGLDSLLLFGTNNSSTTSAGSSNVAVKAKESSAAGLMASDLYPAGKETTGSSEKSNAAPGGDIDVNFDNLDELESYLQSLGTPSS